MPGWLIGLLFVFKPIGNFLFKKSTQKLESNTDISENPIIKKIVGIIAYIFLIWLGIGLLLMMLSNI